MGWAAGFNNTGSSNIFIGFQSGTDAAMVGLSNTLVIDNDANASPYIFGDILNKNLGLNGVTSWGTNAVGVFAIGNGTAPTTSVANEIQLFSVDSSDVTATLGLFLEQVEEAIGATVATHKIKVLINGNERYLLLSTI